MTVRRKVELTIRRGEIYRVRPDPTVGHEQQKTRPCVIVSSDAVNENSSLVVVCPLTEGKKLNPTIFHISIAEGEGGASKASFVLCNQVKAVDKVRLQERMGNLRPDTMAKIDAGLRALLHLP